MATRTRRAALTEPASWWWSSSSVVAVVVPSAGRPSIVTVEPFGACVSAVRVLGLDDAGLRSGRWSAACCCVDLEAGALEGAASRPAATGSSRPGRSPVCGPFETLRVIVVPFGAAFRSGSGRGDLSAVALLVDVVDGVVEPGALQRGGRVRQLVADDVRDCRPTPAPSSRSALTVEPDDDRLPRLRSRRRHLALRVARDLDDLPASARPREGPAPPAPLLADDLAGTVAFGFPVEYQIVTVPPLGPSCRRPDPAGRRCPARRRLARLRHGVRVEVRGA